MNKLAVVSILVLGVVIALCSAYPSSYGAPYGNNYNAQSYDGAGFEPAYPPTFGSGFDTYVYGSYQGHPGPYDSYGKPDYGKPAYGGYQQQPSHTVYGGSYNY